MWLRSVIFCAALAVGALSCSDIGGQKVCNDPACSQGQSLGCNAGGQGQNCRFCGFDDFPACPADCNGGGGGTQGGGGDPPSGGDCNSGGGRVCFKLKNNCAYPIWPGVQGSTVPNGGGFRLNPGAQANVFVPDHWSAGRIWARTGCDGNFNCDTGFCGNAEQCSGRGGVPPVTLAEFTLAAANAGNQDFYDLSLVDGYNLPISIEPVAGTFTTNGGQYDCKLAGQCNRDLNQICPPELQEVAHGKVVACKSACLAFNTDQYCCRGAHGTAATCKSSDWPKNYPAIFKSACPTDYSYAYDDTTSTFTCRGKGTPSPVYQINFC